MNQYNAFISYSHKVDGKLALALQSALEKLAKPWYKLRNLNIFRDESDLSATPHLWSNIRKALDASEYLVYMASPEAERSKWIKKEIEYWLEYKSVETLLIVLTEGEIEWDFHNNSFVNPNNNSLPNSLDHAFDQAPFYIDLRASKEKQDTTLKNPIFKKEVLKLAAQLHGKAPKDLASDEVRSHNTMLAARNSAISLLLVLLGISIFQTYEARKQAKIAKEQTIIAKEQARIARDSSKSAQIQRSIAQEQSKIARDSSIAAQEQRELAEEQSKIAIEQRDRAQSNYLISEAKRQVENDPTVALRLAEAAIQMQPNDHNLLRDANRIYRENTFYKIIARHSDNLSSVAFSPDGKTILTGSSDSTARLWDLNGNPLSIPIKHSGMVSSVAFSPDGKTILTGASDYAARLWDLKGNPLGKPIKHSWIVDNIAISPKRKTLLTTSSIFGGEAKLWDLNGNPIGKPIMHRGNFTSVAFSPNGKFILMGTSYVSSHHNLSGYGSAHLWDLQGDLIGKPMVHSNGSVTSVAFSPDGQTILTGSVDKTACLWDLHGNQIGQPIMHKGKVTSVAFSPDGNIIVTGYNPDKGAWSSSDKINGTARLWDLKGHPVGKLLKHSSAINSVSFSPDGHSILTSTIDGKAWLWDLKGTFLYDLKGILKVQGEDFTKINSSDLAHTNPTAISPDGTMLLTGSLNNRARLWDMRGNPIGMPMKHADRVESVSFSPDGSFIITGSRDSIARVWDLEGNHIGKPMKHEGSVSSVAFSPDGQTVLTGSQDGTARLWDLEGNPLGKPLNHSGNVTSVSFTRDTKNILTSSFEDGESNKWIVRLWDIKGALRRTFINDANRIMSVAFSPDGKTVITGSGDSRVQLWELDRNLVKEFNGHTAAVWLVAFAHDGKTVLTGSWDNTVRLWDLQGNQIAQPFEHDNRVSSIAFSPDGKTILTGAYIFTKNNDPLLSLNCRLWRAAKPLSDYLKRNNIEPLSDDNKKKFGIY